MPRGQRKDSHVVAVYHLESVACLGWSRRGLAQTEAGLSVEELTGDLQVA